MHADLTILMQDGPENRTPLHLACQVGDPVAVEILLSRSDIISNAQDETGCTPLHLAIFGKSDLQY